MNSTNHTSKDRQLDPAAAALLFRIANAPVLPDRRPEVREESVADARPNTGSPMPGLRPKPVDPLSSRGHPEVDSPLAG